MEILTQSTETKFPLLWANLNQYRSSDAERREIYVTNHDDLKKEMIFLFYKLFGPSKEKLLVFHSSWWNFCIDTWDIENDEYNYELTGKSNESQAYLKMLSESNIDKGFGGVCKCNQWDSFLPTILSCIIPNIAPYSPIFFNETDQYFFYFHYSGSIGIYFKETNAAIVDILNNANIFTIAE